MRTLKNTDCFLKTTVNEGNSGMSAWRYRCDHENRDNVFTTDLNGVSFYWVIKQQPKFVLSF